MQNVQPKEVCPHCGQPWFIWVRKAQETVLVNSAFEASRVISTEVVDYYDEEAEPQPVCVNCGSKVPTFVSESFFHNVICDPIYYDTIPGFVSGKRLRHYIRMIDQPFDINATPPEPICIVSESHGFMLKVHLRRDETDTLRLAATILTVEPVTTEHVKTVEHDVEVSCPPAVAGRYVFRWKDQLMSVYLMEENVESSPDADEIDLAVVERSGGMTPVKYVVILSESVVRDTQYYTGNPADMDKDIEFQNEDAWFDLNGKDVVLAYEEAHSASQARGIVASKYEIDASLLTAFPLLPDVRIEDLTKGNAESNEPQWTLILNVPGEDLPFIFRHEDDRVIGMAMKTYMQSGATKEMFTLLPPAVAFNIDEFLGRFPQ